MTRGKAALAVAVLALAAVVPVPYENPFGDALGYGVRMRDGAPLPVNPNHLLLEPISRGTYAAVSRLADVDPLTTLLWASRLSYVAYGLLTFGIASMLFPGVWLPFAVATGVLASYGILVFGTDGEPILFAHLPWLAAAAVHLHAWQKRRMWLHVAAGLGYGFSILVYVSNAVPIGVIGLAALVAVSGRRPATPLVAPLVGAVVAGGGVLLAHALSGSPLPVHRWLLSYAGGESNLSFGGAARLGLFRTVFGFGGSLVGTRGAARLVRYWTEGEGSIRPETGDAVDLVVWTIALAAAAGLTVAAIRRLPRGHGVAQAVLFVCLASVALLASFNFRWIGSDPQFWVPVLPPLWIAWGFALHPSPRRVKVAAGVCLLVLLPWNLFGSVRPLRGDLDPEFRRAELMERTEEPCLVVVPGCDWVDGYGRYYGLGDRSVLSFWRMSIDPAWAENPDAYLVAADSTIGAALDAGRPVYVRGILDEPFPDGIPWREMAPRGFRFDEIRALLETYPGEPAFTIRGRNWWRLDARDSAAS